MKNQQPLPRRRRLQRVAIFMATAGMLAATAVKAQSISNGLTGASTAVTGIFANVSTLCLVVGGIVGLVGGIRVYIRWNQGEQDIQKEAIGWGGACVFLLLTSVTLKAFFGI